MIDVIRGHKVFMGVFVLIFFFNRVLLPSNLQFSILLVPFFVYYLLKEKQFYKSIRIIGVLFIIGLLGISRNTNLPDYIVSSFVLFSLMIFSHALYVNVRKVEDFGALIKRLTLINIALVIIALVCLFIPFLKPFFWYLIPFTSGYEVIPRLKLFELEASHYSLAIAPLFLYYFWKLLKKFNWRELFLFLSLFVSLILSFSLGVLGVLAISILLVLLSNFFNLIVRNNSRRILFLLLSFTVIGLLLLYILFPDNPLFFRVSNVFSGEDTSSRGRTYEAFNIALITLKEQSSEWFGIGLGQFKSLGKEVLINFYKYPVEPTIIRLPNCMAETLVTYGYFGLILKLAIQIILFFWLKVYLNIYRFSLFVSIFIYQFTGSFLFNTMEYILWVLCFSPIFNSFSTKSFFKK